VRVAVRHPFVEIPQLLEERLPGQIAFKPTMAISMGFLFDPSSAKSQAGYTLREPFGT
jgi:hypothetical protein